MEKTFFVLLIIALSITCVSFSISKACATGPADLKNFQNAGSSHERNPDERFLARSDTGNEHFSYPENNDGSGGHAFIEELKDGFDYLFKTLVFGTTQKPSGSSLNPDNFLEIPRYTLQGELRPNFSLNFKNFDFFFRPRFNLNWQKGEDGKIAGETKTDEDFFINEWLARFQLFQRVHLSYGRENLQWGPSFLISPSNPFFRDNGLSNPKLEVPGQDFGRLVWVINSSWTTSLIANTDEGRQEYARGFDPAYAIKLDWTSFKKYASLLGSVREGERLRFGGFAGWTATDGLMLYAEAGDIGQGTEVLYPVEDPSSPLGIDLKPSKKDDSSLEAVLLLGASYTFGTGPNLTVEYVFNSPGYNDKEADKFFEFSKRASQALLHPDPVAGFSPLDVGVGMDPGLRLLRRNYVMVQYRHSQINNVLDLVIRYAYNIDDCSSRLIPFAEYAINDHLQFFMVGSHNFGPDDSEAKLLVDYSWMAGFEMTF